MITDCRSILADEHRASRTVIGHAIIQPKLKRIQASGTGNALGHSTAPHAFVPNVALGSKIDEYTVIDISSGGCQIYPFGHPFHSTTLHALPMHWGEAASHTKV